jgi:hypothetical protein
VPDSLTVEIHFERVLKQVFITCLLVEVALVFLDVTVNRWQWSDHGAIQRMFNITREDGMASWFAVFQTSMVALTAWIICGLTKLKSGKVQFRWLVVALLFSYMTIDDGAAVHERVGTALSQSAAVAGFPSYAWQVIFVPLFASVGAYIFFSLWRDFGTVQEKVRIFSAFSCFAVAVVLDFFEGMDNAYVYLYNWFEWSSREIRHYSKSLEEFVEMVGMSIFLVTFLGFIPRLANGINIRFIQRFESS